MRGREKRIIAFPLLCAAATVAGCMATAHPRIGTRLVVEYMKGPGAEEAALAEANKSCAEIGKGARFVQYKMDAGYYAQAWFECVGSADDQAPGAAAKDKQ